MYDPYICNCDDVMNGKELNYQEISEQEQCLLIHILEMKRFRITTLSK